MASILLGCDENDSKDKSNQKTVARILEKAGHEVEILRVNRTVLQNTMTNKSSKGKIAVFMVNGADLQTYRDFYDGMTRGYYHTKYGYFALQGWISPSTCSCKGAKTAKLKRAHDDQSPVSYTEHLVGMTTAEVMEKYKSKIAYACGSSPKELGNNLVKIIGGGSNDSSSSSKDSGSSIKEAIKDVLYNWDGEAECFIRDDTLIIRKIPSPSSATLSLIEGQNIDFDSVTVTDYNPSTVNHLTCDFKDYVLTIQDEYLIKRFGKIHSKITLDKNIKTLKSAKQFLQREWNKLKRDNGHNLEVKTYGHSKWKIGEWCRVYLPSFNINDYMYITKVSQEDSPGEWNCNLTLVDWPPGFGEPTKTEDDSKKDRGST